MSQGSLITLAYGSSRKRRHMIEVQPEEDEKTRIRRFSASGKTGESYKVTTEGNEHNRSDHFNLVLKFRWVSAFEADLTNFHSTFFKQRGWDWIDGPNTVQQLIRRTALWQIANIWETSKTFSHGDWSDLRCHFLWTESNWERYWFLFSFLSQSTNENEQEWITQGDSTRRSFAWLHMSSNLHKTPAFKNRGPLFLCDGIN